MRVNAGRRLHIFSRSGEAARGGEAMVGGYGEGGGGDSEARVRRLNIYFC